MNAKTQMHKDGVEGYQPVSRKQNDALSDVDVYSRDMVDPEDWQGAHAVGPAMTCSTSV